MIIRDILQPSKNKRFDIPKLFYRLIENQWMNPLDKIEVKSYIYDIVYCMNSDVTITETDMRLAKMLKALGNPIRFQIMEMLAAKQSCMTYEIVDSTPLAQSTISQHLKVLREAGLIHGEIEGPATCYCINPEGVRWLKEQIESWLPDCCSV